MQLVLESNGMMIVPFAESVRKRMRERERERERAFYFQ